MVASFIQTSGPANGGTQTFELIVKTDAAATAGTVLKTLPRIRPRPPTRHDKQFINAEYYGGNLNRPVSTKRRIEINPLLPNSPQERHGNR
jgi:hypothetical protein